MTDTPKNNTPKKELDKYKDIVENLIGRTQDFHNADDLKDHMDDFKHDFVTLTQCFPLKSDIEKMYKAIIDDASIENGEKKVLLLNLKSVMQKSIKNAQAKMAEISANIDELF